MPTHLVHEEIKSGFTVGRKEKLMRSIAGCMDQSVVA